MRISLLWYYLYYCLRYRVVPWNFFQLNSRYFNDRKGIFSKLDTDAFIPRQNHLTQYQLSRENLPKTYPVFLKPEWGQNSNGIRRIDTEEQYLEFVDKIPKLKIPYIVQEAALGEKEFEIYYLRSPEDKGCCSFLSITEVINNNGECYPVNSIYNASTVYRDVTAQLSSENLEKIWKTVKNIGDFRMARIGVKTDDVSLLAQGVFKILEINLFLPMPLVLLTDNVSKERKIAIIRETMKIAAQLVKTIPQAEKGKWIFFQKMRAHYKTAL